VLGVGDRVPDARVWIAPRERVAIADLAAADAPALFLFYLFDWSST
jgi:hypothetical protein